MDKVIGNKWILIALGITNFVIAVLNLSQALTCVNLPTSLIVGVVCMCIAILDGLVACLDWLGTEMRY
jgi:hypothetical protein